MATGSSSDGTGNTGDRVIRPLIWEKSIPVRLVAPSGNARNCTLTFSHVSSIQYNPSDDGFKDGFDRPVQTNNPWMQGYEIFTNEVGVKKYGAHLAEKNKGKDILTTRPMR